MSQYTPYIICSFAVSMLCGFVCIPAIIDFCVKRKLYDMPNVRKVHKKAIPRLGGISFLPSMLLAFIMAMVIFNSSNNSAADRKIEISLWSYFFLVSLMLIYIMGVVDDMIGLDAKVKFVVQIIAVALMPVAGLYINNLYGLLGIYTIPYWIGAPLTIFLMVFIVNAMNLIDGIDGLAGCLSLVALGGFLVSFAGEQMWIYCLLIAGVMGVVVAFLYFNIFGKPERNRKVFMGDTGSLTLGFILAFLFVKFSMDNPQVKPFHRDSMLLAYTLLIVPVFDVARVIIVRLFHRKPLFSADKNHLHHKLMRAGLGQHGALICALFLALFYIALNMLVYKNCAAYIKSVTNVVLVVDVLVWCLFHAALNVRIRQCGEKPYLKLKE